MKWQTVSAVLTTLINPLFIVFLSRIFSPEQFGIIAINTMIISFAQKISNLGFAQAIIQREDIENKDLNSILVFITFTGLFLIAVINLFAGSIASAYNEPVLINLIRISSLLFIIQPIGSVYQTLLKRDLNYNLLTKVSLIGFLIQKVMIILLAFWGMGLISYPLGFIIGALVDNLLLFIIFFKSNIWKPAFEFSSSSIRKFLKFGLFITAQSLSSNLFYYIDEIIISILFNTETLGIYYFVKNLFNNLNKLLDKTISQVLYPIFCKLNSYDEAFYNLAVKLIKSITFAVLPISLGVALTGSLFIPIFFGEQWSDSVDLIVLMSFWSIFYLSTIVFTGPIYAKGKADWIFYLSIAEFPVRTIFLYIAGLYSIKTFIVTLILLQFSKFLAYLFAMNRLIGLKLTTTFGNIMHMYLASAIAYAVASLIKLHVTWRFGSFISLIIVFGIFLVLYLFFVYRTDKELVKFIRSMLKSI